MHTLLILAVGFVCASLSEKLNETSENFGKRIIDGDNAKRHQFRYMLSIQHRSNSIHICGAAIVSPTWAASAAHCYYNQEVDYFAVAGLLKQREIHSDIQIKLVAEVVIHPNYDPIYYWNDIALLKMASGFMYNKAVQPVFLPLKQNYMGQTVLSGWGHVSDIEPIFPHTLQYLNMPLISNRECNIILESLHSYPYLVDDTKICTLPSEVGQSGCHGDSGSPLVKIEDNTNILVGIVHGGDIHCGELLNTSVPNIFTKVSVFLDFIKNVVEDLNVKPVIHCENDYP